MLMKAEGPVKSVSMKSAAAFRTISEVSGDLDVPQHVLRFWETKFLRRIQSLLYQEGYTIKGVQRLLKENRGTLPPGPVPQPRPDEEGAIPPVPTPSADEAATAASDAETPVAALSDDARREIEAVLGELRELRALLAGRRG